MFFDHWQDIGRLMVVGPASYAILVVMLRLSGKRTLSKMNSFDFIVTIALGSSLSTIILSRDVSLVEGIAALGLLVGLQYLINWLTVRSPFFQRLVKNEPALLFHKGRELPAAMQRERVTSEDLLQILRSQGVAQASQVHAIVLETDGTFSVLSENQGQASDTLTNVAAV